MRSAGRTCDVAKMRGHHGKKGPNGRRLCYWCGTEVKTKQANYCSENCRTEVWIRSSPGTAWVMVMTRDHGICAKCGLDTKQFKKDLEASVEPMRKQSRRLHRILSYLERRGARPFGSETGWLVPEPHRTALRNRLAPLRAKARALVVEADETVRRALLERGFNPGQALWDADHIIPVAAGGGLCGLDGYQTLCTPCHKAKSAQEAAQRASRRRKDKRETGPQPDIFPAVGA